MAQRRDPGAKSADRALDLLEHVARSTRPPSFADLSEALDIPKSSLFHLLHSLSRRGYLEQVRARGGYRLGAAVADLARQAGSPDSVIGVVRPLVGELSAALNETCGFYERRGDFAELRAASSAVHSLRIEMPLGRMLPLYAASNGRVILAKMTDPEVEAYIARTAFERFTPNTLTSPDELRRQITQIRQTGFSHTRGEFAAGITSIAVGVAHAGRMIGSIGVMMPIARYADAVGLEARRQLLTAACRFERACDELSPAAFEDAEPG